MSSSSSSLSLATRQFSTVEDAKKENKTSGKNDDEKAQGELQQQQQLPFTRDVYAVRFGSWLNLIRAGRLVVTTKPNAPPTLTFNSLLGGRICLDETFCVMKSSDVVLAGLVSNFGITVTKSDGSKITYDVGPKTAKELYTCIQDALTEYTRTSKS